MTPPPFGEQVRAARDGEVAGDLRGRAFPAVGRLAVTLTAEDLVRSAEIVPDGGLDTCV
ncbi:hypothetical protein AB0L14_12555 [Streptomyces sp. NPDC052727]|uniref:hypothetical protein n=1 Tax=Streptomyces sp. NPDC052727 TaxID=3154854 RepID=UPI0034306BD6